MVFRVKLETVILTGVLLLALILRILALGQQPVHLAIDEIANGYNAYSILSEGKDEWGISFPLTFKSFDDYKPPVHIYTIVPLLWLFGNTEFAVRLPVAILGSLSVLLAYALMRVLKVGKVAALFAAFWLAINPWHIHFSRGTFEAVIALFFALGGVVAFYKWIDKRSSNWAMLSAAGFSLSVWSYHAERLFVPILVLVLLYSRRKSLLSTSYRVSLRSFLATAILFAFPLIHLAFTTPAVATRAQSTSILRDSVLRTQLHNGTYSTLFESIVDNDIYIIFQHWLHGYLGYFDLNFWFWDGLELTLEGLPDMGLMYTPDILLFCIGTYALLRSKKARLRTLALAWAFIGPLPASMAMNPQHPLRALVWLPFFVLVVTTGFDFLRKRQKRIASMLLIAYFLGICANGIYFADIYTKQMPRLMSEFWQYGYKEISLWACEHESQYTNIYVSESFGEFTQITGSPQHYLGFYCKRNYLEFLGHPSEPGILVKRPFFPQDLKDHPNSVFIAAPWDFPIESVEESRIIKRQYFLNGKLAFIYVETDKK